MRIPGIQRGKPLSVTVNGQQVEAYAGESIAAVLTAANFRTIRRTFGGKAPRGVFCGMGICFDCLVTVDGVPNLRACHTQVHDGAAIQVEAI